MRRLKFGIIGCGRIAQRHAEHIKTYGELLAVCDIDFKKAEELGSNYNANPYSLIDELLDKEKGIDIITICSPNGLHAEHTIKALNSGFHVLCEKPMAISVHDCGEMIKVAEQNNKRLFAIKQNRFNPPVAAVKKIIDEGRLGKLLSVQLSCFWNRNKDYYKDSWKGSSDLDGGTLFTQYSHFIDLLYWIAGDIKDVEAYFDNFIHNNDIEFEDTGVVIIRFYNGALGTINYNVNSYNKNMEGSLTIFGEKGTVKIGGQYLNELEYQNIENYKIKGLPEGNSANNYGRYQGSMSNHDEVYKNLISVFLDDGIISTSAFEGLKTIEIISKIYSKK